MVFFSFRKNKYSNFAADISAPQVFQNRVIHTTQAIPQTHHASLAKVFFFSVMARQKARKQRYRNLSLAFLLGKCNCFFDLTPNACKIVTAVYLSVKKRRLNHQMWWLDVGELTEKVSCCFFQIQEHRLSYGVYALKNQKKSAHGPMMYAWLKPKALDMKTFLTESHRRSNLKVTTFWETTFTIKNHEGLKKTVMHVEKEKNDLNLIRSI